MSDPNNYRPIVLVGVLSKLLTSILNKGNNKITELRTILQRESQNSGLLSWSEDEGKLIHNQFGFRPGRSTVDAIFILHGIISNILQNKLKLYSAFVDFRKAFDKLNRKILIYKLLRNGLSTKFVAMVKSTYSSVGLRVKAGGVLSDAFDNLLGVKQGDHYILCYFYFYK